MKFHQMQYFQAVCKQGSITKAAELLNISQPSITLAIKELESDLKVNLFRRTYNKKLALTGEGEYFLVQIEKILNEIDNLTEKMQDMGGKRNLIKLGMPIQVGALFLPLLINNFQQRYPEIELELIECDSSHIMEMLMDEKLDIAIASADFCENNLDVEILYHTEICFCVHKSHPMARLVNISLSEAAAVPLVMLAPYYYTSRRLDQRVRMEGLTLNVKLYTDRLHTIKNLVVNAGLGTFLLRDAIRYDKDIIPIPVRDPLIATVAMVTKKGRQIYEDSRKMMCYIQQEYELLKG